MKNIRRLAMAFCLCSFVFVPGFATELFAIDLTLNIPVELINMPTTVSQGYISCSAFGADRVHNKIFPAQQPLGDGNVKFEIKGNYVATARISIKNDKPNPPNGLGYKCALFLVDTARDQDKEKAGYQLAYTVLSRYAIDTSKPTKFEVQGIR